MCAWIWLGNSLVAAHRCLPIAHVGIILDWIMQVACVMNSLLQIWRSISITKVVKIQCCGLSVRKSFGRKKLAKCVH